MIENTKSKGAFTYDVRWFGGIFKCDELALALLKIEVLPFALRQNLDKNQNLDKQINLFPYSNHLCEDFNNLNKEFLPKKILPKKFLSKNSSKKILQKTIPKKFPKKFKKFPKNIQLEISCQSNFS